MGIDWTLLLLIVIGAVAVIGLILALQTRGGRGRLADAALRLAESLIAYAIRWLERNHAGNGSGNVPASATSENGQRIADARAALMILRGI